jgi:hypothetical protein
MQLVQDARKKRDDDMMQLGQEMTNKREITMTIGK